MNPVTTPAAQARPSRSARAADLAQAGDDATPIATRMYLATRDTHTRAENHRFVTSLRTRALPRAAFVQYLTDLHVVYEALENLLGKQTAFDDGLLPDSLRRAHGLADDIATFSAMADQPAPAGGAGHGQDAAPGPSQAASDYVDHLHKLDNEDPTLLLAHAYVRYMGDMMGGRMIKTWVRQGFGIELASGDFSRFKEEGYSGTGWKDALNATPLSAHQQIRMTDEAEQAFASSVAIMTAALAAG